MYLSQRLRCDQHWEVGNLYLLTSHTLGELSESYQLIVGMQYKLPRTSHVPLKVYNTLGQEVAPLVDAVEEPGYKLVQWDAHGLASSVYFCRLQAPIESGQAGDFVQTRKLLVLM